MFIKMKSLALVVTLGRTLTVLLCSHGILQPSLGAQALAGGGAQQGSAKGTPRSEFDRLVQRNAEEMIEQGRQIFRYETHSAVRLFGVRRCNYIRPLLAEERRY
jgi:hypothetical protein